MMTIIKLNLHYLGLTFVIALAIVLRFWNLELKPLWMDEVITAIFSLGKNYSSIPLDVIFSLDSLRDVFSYQTGVSCPQVAQNIATESTHPPLFFCGMYAFLGWMNPLGENWVGKLRSPSVWFGVGLVVAVYFLNRLAFSRKAGLMGAAFVAVSPFAVYLSQEARHYTLPMLAIGLSLLALIQIQQDIFQRQQVRIWLWLIWTIINIIAIYIHYFCIIAFIAQVATLLLLAWRKVGSSLLLSTITVVISLIPWFGIVLNHLNRSETSWLPTPQNIEPLYQTLISWVVMVIMLPVEHQPLPIIIVSALLMLLFTGWLGWKVFRGIKLLLQDSVTRLSTLTLLSFTALVLLGIFMISYILGKDITVAPRYNFIYYPSFSALIAASLISNNNSFPQEEHRSNTNFKIKNRSLLIILLIGFISCIFVVYNLAFHKPYLPKQVAQNIYQEPSVPVMAIMAYSNYQDVALGLSFALALEKEIQISQNSNNPALKYSKFGFLNQSSDFQSIFKQLSQLPNQNISQLNLWIFAPGRRRRDYPQKTRVSQLSCNIDVDRHYRIGIPYQLYRCKI
ncbi:MAG: glycosyltransferase family 39 protein [Cyanobacteria bacterium J06635_10]